MNSVRVYVLVEGPTEQTFLRDVLAPAMSCRGVHLYPARIGRSGHKDGNIRFDRARTDIEHFLRQQRDTYVSTMFDYFRIDPDWPGRAEVYGRLKSGAKLRAQEKASILETATQRAPSKQILTLNNRYRKVAMGKVIAETIGIPTLRQKCVHFDEWLRTLEGLVGRTSMERKKNT